MWTRKIDYISMIQKMDIGRHIYIILKGRSMLPTYHEGDKLLLVIGNTQIRKGDVVARKDDASGITIHRIVDIKNHNGKTEVLTKGDHNPYFDEWCIIDDIIGVIRDESSCSVSTDFKY